MDALYKNIIRVSQKTLDDIITIKRYAISSDLFRTHEKNYGLFQYKKLMCSITFNIGRQSGITSYIKNHCRKRDLIIVYYDIQHKNYNCDVVQINQIHKIRNMDYNNIWIDGDLNIGNKDEIIELLARDNLEQLFIFLG